MWSDTGNERFDSKGDIIRKVNLDCLNIQGPNMSQSRLHQGKKEGPHKEGSTFIL